MPVCYADKFQVKKESIVFLLKLDVRLSKTEKLFLAGLSQSSVRINFSPVHVRTVHQSMQPVIFVLNYPSKTTTQAHYVFQVNMGL